MYSFSFMNEHLLSKKEKGVVRTCQRGVPWVVIVETLHYNKMDSLMTPKRGSRVKEGRALFTGPP
jgi:hypothetical protein